jgi:hypothetical protein
MNWLDNKLYCGFYLEDAVGNNAFSHERRRNKRIYVPPLINGGVSDLRIGRQIVFSEIEDGLERNCIGLENFIATEWQRRPLFIFDNHNHAFFFWFLAWQKNIFADGAILVHIDQHSDMREPAEYPPWLTDKTTNPEMVFNYTNRILNVGNFINPALRSGMFSEARILNSLADFAEPATQLPMILDLDMDIFSNDMAYIPEQDKIAGIRSCLKHAQLITVATSPYFIDQTSALQSLKEIFANI